MLALAATTDKIQLLTSAAVALDVHATYADLLSGAVTPGRQNTAITTATTTDILAAPAASTYRNLKTLTVYNKTGLPNDVTVIFNQNGTSYSLCKVTLNGGETLEYSEMLGFYVVRGTQVPDAVVSTADQSLPAATTTYITGTAITFPTGRPLKVGSKLIWNITLTKTGAGTLASTFDVRFGTNGTTADTSRLSFALGAGTAVADTGHVEIVAICRGPIGASCIFSSRLNFEHNLSATGFLLIPVAVLQVASGAFDCTTAGIIAGVSVTTGTAQAWTAEQASGEVVNV
jgi:hypothetical protein